MVERYRSPEMYVEAKVFVKMCAQCDMTVP